MTVNNGDLAKDKITGLEGVVVRITSYLHGCRRISLLPRELVNGKIAEWSVLDEPQLEVVQAEFIKPSIVKRIVPKILGCRAEDKITGLTGIVLAYSIHLYEDALVSVQPAEIKDGQQADWISFPLDRLKFISRDFCPKEEAEVPAKKFGGPAYLEPPRPRSMMKS